MIGSKQIEKFLSFSGIWDHILNKARVLKLISVSRETICIPTGIQFVIQIRNKIILIYNRSESYLERPEQMIRIWQGINAIQAYDRYAIFGEI